jgi:predicted enzyme related to lactoylglutathione lyase
MGRVVGIGGLFIKSPQPSVMRAWYRDVLGLNLEEWGGGVIQRENSAPNYQVWTIFPSDTEYYTPSQSPFMLNLAVDDLGALISQIRNLGSDICGGPEVNEYGSFAWILDPDGNKIELWQKPEPETE